MCSSRGRGAARCLRHSAAIGVVARSLSDQCGPSTADYRCPSQSQGHLACRSLETQSLNVQPLSGDHPGGCNGNGLEIDGGRHPPCPKGLANVMSGNSTVSVVATSMVRSGTVTRVPATVFDC